MYDIFDSESAVQEIMSGNKLSREEALQKAGKIQRLFGFDDFDEALRFLLAATRKRVSIGIFLNE